MTEVLGKDSLLSPELTARAQKEGLTFEALGSGPTSDEGRYPSMLYYGGAGTGKTHFLATAGPRTFIVNIGNGLVTIQSPLVAQKYYREGLPIVTTIREEIDPKTGIFKIADGFDKVEAAILFALQHFPERFDTIAIDEASALKAFALHKGLVMNDDLGKSKTLTRAKEHGSVSPLVQDFGEEMRLVEEFVTQTIEFCKAHRKNFVLTAHERYTWKKMKDEKGKVIGEEVDKIRPGFTGRTFPDDVTRLFDLVWRAEVVQAQPAAVYRAYTEDSRSIKAKSRYPGVFNALEKEPNFQDILRRVRSSLDGTILPKAERTPSKERSNAVRT